MSNLFKPEICYDFIPLTLEEIHKAHKNNETITGYVEEIYPNEHYISVRLHQDLFAVLPYNEVSIYENEYVDSEDYKMARILKGKNIRMKVTNIQGENVYVSRRKSMMEALSHLKNCDCVVSHVYYITKNCACADIGNGIVGYIPINEMAVSYIKSICEYINKGAILKLKILNFNHQNTAYMSYHQALPKTNVKVGSLVDCNVTRKVDDIPTGYFALINPTLCGIVDKTLYCPYLLYGDRIQCVVVGKSKSGLKLRFLKMLHKKASKVSH